MPISRQYAGYRSTASPYRCCASHNSNCADATANTHSTVHSLPDTDPNAHANKAFAEVATLSIHARVISIPVSPLLVPPRPPKSLILEPVLSKFKHGELDPVEPFGAGQSNFFVCVFVRTRTSRPRGSRCSSPRCGEALYAVRVLARQPAFANIKLPAREWSERGRRDIDHRTRGARVSTGSERINTFGL